MKMTPSLLLVFLITIHFKFSNKSPPIPNVAPESSDLAIWNLSKKLMNKKWSSQWRVRRICIRPQQIRRYRGKIRYMLASTALVIAIKKINQEDEKRVRRNLQNTYSTTVSAVLKVETKRKMRKNILKSYLIILWCRFNRAFWMWI